jgi:hypothetical protein
MGYIGVLNLRDIRSMGGYYRPLFLGAGYRGVGAGKTPYFAYGLVKWKIGINILWDLPRKLV